MTRREAGNAQKIPLDHAMRRGPLAAKALRRVSVDCGTNEEGDMSKAGLAGMQLATQDIINVARGLSADEWATESAARGWTVHDVVSHAGNLIGVVLDAVNGQLVTPDSMGIEALNDKQVEAKRSQDPMEGVTFLEEQLAKAVPSSPNSRTSRTPRRKPRCLTS